MRIKKIADFTGTIPQGVEQYIGTSGVEASQITSSFGRSNEAINWVNRYNADLLKNIAFIYNYTGNDAFGIYMSEVDRKVKTPKLQKELEQQGYIIKTTEQGLTALPKEGTDKTAEQIKADIDNAWKKLQQIGGTALGINIAKDIKQAKEDADKINNAKPMEQRDADLWQWLGIIHVGSTIVHEAVHAKGNTSEGPSEQGEAAFTSWLLPQINQEYKRSLDGQKKGDQYSEITMGGKVYAKGNTWYRTAQMSYYIPQSFMEKALGSDLAGRFPTGIQADQGTALWGMMAQEGNKLPIESKLGRQFMAPIPKNLNQSNDILEEQLRKYTKDDLKLDPKASMTELLTPGYDRDRGYTTLEGLLDEKRVKPLLVPIKKNASVNMVKAATLFGWMNNLQISDGSTIPGLGDRVMAWDDRDEDFSEEESWIKKQPRYNPSGYDRRGIFYELFEWQFQPQAWTEMMGDGTNTHPAKRFASAKIDRELARVLSVLSTAKNKIAKNEIATTRFIITQDILPIVEKIFDGSNLQINVFELSDSSSTKESIYSVWISSPAVTEEDIEQTEKILQNKTIDKVEADKIIDDMFGVSKQREKSINEILETVKDLCISYEVNNLYVIGSYPRDIVMGSPIYKMEELDFCGGEGDLSIKLGGLAAEILGVRNVKINAKTMILSFTYKNINVSFGGDYNPQEIKGGLRDVGIEPNSLNTDIFNRDFTINMLIYDIMGDKIIDISKLALEDLKRKTIKTFFDADYVCKLSPMVILRALKLKLKYGFEIDPSLQKAMIDNASLLLDGRYSEAKLFLASENVKREGCKLAEILFENFGLDKLNYIE